MRASAGFTGLVSLLWALACTGGPGLDEPITGEPTKPGPLGIDRREPDPPQAPTPPPGPAPAAPIGPMLPLAVGHQWTYTLHQRTGAGARIFGFATVKPSESQTAEWSFAIDSVEAFPDGERYHAKLTRSPTGDDLPSTTEMLLEERNGVVWMNAGNGERPAIEAVIPPGAVSSERVRCVAHMLGGVVGSCPPVAGGPLGARPGLEHGVVAADSRDGAEIGQFLVGIATVGIFIPGNRKRVETADLRGFTAGEGHAADFAGSGDPLVDAVRSGIDEAPQLLKRIAEHGAAPESVAAAVASLPEGRVLTVTLGILPAVAPVDRYPVVRTAIQHVDAPLRAFAQLRGQLDAEIPDEQAAALLAIFELDQDRESAKALISGAGTLFVALLSEVDGPFDSDVTEVLDRELDKHPVTGDEILRILGLYTFDDGKRDAAEKLLTRIPEDQHPAVILRILKALTFDDARMKLIEAHVDALKALPAARREEYVEAITFQQDEARVLLGLDPE